MGLCFTKVASGPGNNLFSGVLSRPNSNFGQIGARRSSTLARRGQDRKFKALQFAWLQLGNVVVEWGCGKARLTSSRIPTWFLVAVSRFSGALCSSNGNESLPVRSPEVSRGKQRSDHVVRERILGWRKHIFSLKPFPLVARSVLAADVPRSAHFQPPRGRATAAVASVMLADASLSSPPVPCIRDQEPEALAYSAFFS